VTEVKEVKMNDGTVEDKREVIAPLRTYDWTGDAHDTQALIHHVEETYDAVGEVTDKTKIAALILDGSGECQKALRTLPARYASIIHVWCVSHQHNLVMGDVLRKDETSARIVAKTIDATRYLNDNDKSRIIIERAVGNEIHFGTANATRWNSTTDLIRKLLNANTEGKVKAAASSNAIEWIGRAKTPAARTQVSDVMNELESTVYWENLQNTYDFLKPLSIAQDILQSDWATLDTLVFCWGWLVQHFSAEAIRLMYSDRSDGAALEAISSMEMRWKRMDQLPYIISFIFHPKNYGSNCLSDVPVLSWINIASMTKKLFVRTFEEDCPSMMREVEAWSRQSAMIDADMIREYSKAPRRVWRLLSQPFPYLGRLMVWLYGICTTNAPLERCFSNMGWQYAPRRN
jgi:hypothetical protein